MTAAIFPKTKKNAALIERRYNYTFQSISATVRFAGTNGMTCVV